MSLSSNRSTIPEAASTASITTELKASLPARAWRNFGVVASTSLVIVEGLMYSLPGRLSASLIPGLGDGVGDKVRRNPILPLVR